MRDIDINVFDRVKELESKQSYSTDMMTELENLQGKLKRFQYDIDEYFKEWRNKVDDLYKSFEYTTQTVYEDYYDLECVKQYCNKEYRRYLKIKEHNRYHKSYTEYQKTSLQKLSDLHIDEVGNEITHLYTQYKSTDDGVTPVSFSHDLLQALNNIYEVYVAYHEEWRAYKNDRSEYIRKYPFLEIDIMALINV